MKQCFVLIGLMLAQLCLAQKGDNDWPAIDAYVSTIQGHAPDSLALRLTAPFRTNLQKTRAIYSWITQNIRYHAGALARNRGKTIYTHIWDPTDTMQVWKSGDEMMAIKVLYRRLAVCEGYARLFKVLCDHAGIESKIIFGYARSNMGSRRFRSNHAWNAVNIDGQWKLLDITWASGYFTYFDEYVQQRNDFYYLTPPEDFIQDHYPEDMRWALLPRVPAYRELKQAPFPYKAFEKYRLQIGSNKSGEIECFAGDTLNIVLYAANHTKDKTRIAYGDYDTAAMHTPASAFLQPQINDNEVCYRFIVPPVGVEWLHLLYNNDLVLRYHLRINQKLAVALPAEKARD